MNSFSVSLLILVIAIAASTIVAFTPFSGDRRLQRNSFAIFSRHGRKKWIELGVVPVSPEEDKKRWEASQMRWEASGKKAIYEAKKAANAKPDEPVVVLEEVVSVEAPVAEDAVVA